MYRFSLLLLSLTLLLVSCNKDDSDSTSEEQQIDSGFFALKVGNSWKYNFFSKDGQTGELILMAAVEEVEITQKEVIAGETIFTMVITTSNPDNNCSFCNSEPLITRKVKDSLGYLVEVDGPILFSSENNSDYLVRAEEWGTVFRVLLLNEVLVTVPAGQFVTKDNQRYAILSTGERSNGEDNLYYADGIGEVRQTFSTVLNLNIIGEKQLASYTVD